MGRNAEKRKAKKTGPGSSSGLPSMAGAPEAATLDDGAEGEIAAALGGEGPRSLAGDIDIPSAIAGDGSLAKALFKLTCLLSVRDGRGVPAENMAKVASEIAAIVDADTVSLLRLELGDDIMPARLVLLGSHGLDTVDEGLVTFEVGEGSVAGLVATSGRPLRIEDAPRDPRFHRLYGQRTEIGSLLAMPLRYNGRSGTASGRVLGVVTASRREIKAFSDEDQDRLGAVADSLAQDLEQTRLLFDAVSDPLTGLGSRLSLLVALPREVEMARRYRTDLSLLMFDVDGLRGLNAKGRIYGDRLLVEAGRRLRASLRAVDLPARLGADELAVLLPMTPANAARGLAKRLVRTLAQAIPGVEGEPPTWSVGVATLAVADEDALGLLWRCDEAVASAKKQGGNTIVTAPVKRAPLPE